TAIPDISEIATYVAPTWDGWADVTRDHWCGPSVAQQHHRQCDPPQQQHDRQPDQQHPPGLFAQHVHEGFRGAIAAGRIVLGTNPRLALGLVPGHELLGPRQVLVVADPDTTVGNTPAARLGLVEPDPVFIEHGPDVFDLVVQYIPPVQQQPR